MTTFSWATWHREYGDPDSGLSRRLVHVKRRLTDGLASAPAGPIRLISLCAGEGRDVIGVLPGHPRRDDVTARLVELDPEIAETARSAAAAAGLIGIEVVTGDAALLSNYIDIAPADVVLACGIFGNISESDIRTTIFGLSQLCRHGATVLWTRGRDLLPDLTSAIQSWFAEAGFDTVGYDFEEGHTFGVGAQRFRGEPVALQPDTRLFRFQPRTR